MKILLQDSVFRKHSQTLVANAVRNVLIEEMSTSQLDRYFSVKRVWWDSSLARASKSVLKGMIFENEPEET